MQAPSVSRLNRAARHNVKRASMIGNSTAARLWHYHMVMYNIPKGIITDSYVAEIQL